MCLDYQKQFDTSGIGYKVYFKKEGSYQSEFYRYGEYSEKVYKIGDTYQSSNTLICSDFNYESGFHIFENLEDALSWSKLDQGRTVVVKVCYHTVITTGWESSRPVVVAKQITLIKEIG